MAIDGIVLRQITKQLKDALPAKINKIQQLSDTEILFQLRTHTGNKKLYISTHSVYNRINFTELPYSTLDAPGNFVMVLRKQLDGGIVRKLYQEGLDRILHFEIEARDELGDIHHQHLYFECMGKYANLVFVGEDGRIIDALKRIPPFENNKRTIHPGARYELPQPHLHKVDPFTCDHVEPQIPLTKQLHGFSPQLSEEVQYRMHNGEKFTDIMKQLEASEEIIISDLGDKTFFHIIPMTHLATTWRSYPLMKGLDILYHEKEEKVRIKQQTGDLYKVVKHELHRNQSKLPKLQDSMSEALDCEKYREYGDLLFAYMNTIAREPSVTLPSFHDGSMIAIPLDMRFDAKQNANKYYQKYHKAKRAQEYLEEQIALCEKEIRYFEAMQLQLEQASVDDAQEIREELIRQGYMKENNNKRRRKKQANQPHYECFRFDDISVYVGKNNLQNEYVTWKLANKNDLWLHVKDLHGAHVIITTDQPNESLLRDAAMLAAWYSSARHSSSVPVNYCQVKQLKKIPKTKGSFVSMAHYKTIYIDPDPAHIQQLMDTVRCS